MPAFNTSAWSEPSSRKAKTTSSLTCVSLETSQVLAETFCAGNFLVSSSRVANKSFSLRAHSTTFAPSRRKCSAMVLPSPWLPPVMSALRFLSFMSGTTDGKMLDAGDVFQFFFEKTIGIHKHRLAHLRNDFRPVRLPKLRAFGANGDSFRASQCSRDVRSEQNRTQFWREIFYRWIKRADLCARSQKLLAQFNRCTAAQRVGVRRVSESEDGNFFAAQIAEARLQPAKRPTAMQVVALFNGRNDGNFFEQSFFCVVADANDDTLGFLEGVNRLAQPQIFRRAGEMELRKFLFQLRTGADGQLRGNQNERAVRQMRQYAAQISKNEFDVRFVVVVNRRVVSQPKNVRVCAGDFCVGREGKFFGRETGGDEFVQTGFKQRRLALIQLRNIRHIKIQADDRKMFRAARRRDAAKMPEAEDGDVHLMCGCVSRRPIGFAATIGACARCPAQLSATFSSRCCGFC